MEPLDKIWIKSWVKKYFPDKKSSAKNNRIEKKVQKNVIEITEYIKKLFLADIIDKEETAELKVSEETCKYIYSISEFIKKHKNSVEEYAEKIYNEEWNSLPKELADDVEHILYTDTMLKETLMCMNPSEKALYEYVKKIELLKEQEKEEKRIDKILNEIIYSINLLFDLFIYENGYLRDVTGETVRFKLKNDAWECIYKIYIFIKEQSDGNNYTEKIRDYALKIKKKEWTELPEEISKLLKEVLYNESIYSQLSVSAMPLKYWVRFCVCGLTCLKTTKKQKECIAEELKNITECINSIFDAELNEEGAVCAGDEIIQLVLTKKTWDRIYKIYSCIKNRSKEYIKRINKKEWLKVPDSLSQPVKEILNDEIMLSEIIICKKPLRKWLKAYVVETNPDVTSTSEAKTHRGNESERIQTSKYNDLDSSEQRDYRRVELRKIILRLNCIFEINMDEYGKYEDNGVKKELKVSKKTWDSIIHIYENTKRYTENEKDFFVLMKKKHWERLPESIIRSVNSVLRDELKLSEIYKAKVKLNKETIFSYGNYSNAFPFETNEEICELIKERFVNKISDIAENIRYINEVKAYVEERLPREKMCIPKLFDNWKCVFEKINRLMDKIYENLTYVSENLDNFISSNIDEKTAEEFANFSMKHLITDITDDN